MKIYLDNGATTKVDDEVVKAVTKYFTAEYGNSSSIHQVGRAAKEALENSREIIAKSLNAEPEEIIFTSGGTESNNLAIKGIAFANKEKGNHIIITKVEHDCVLNACRWLETQGFKITYLDVDKEGFIDLEQLKSSINNKTILVSVIHGNNEIGTINDLEAIGKICKENKVLFHTDACQSFTKTEIDVKKQNLDLATINAHKIHGPKGVGALYIKKYTKIIPLFHGGGQEFNKRSGTVNVSGIVGFAKAVELANKADIEKMEKLRDKLINQVLKEISHTMLNGPRKKRLCNNVDISFEFIEGESLLMRLDDQGIEVSTGSACSSKSLEPSHVLLAIGLKHETAHGTLRMTLSKYTTEKEIDKTIKVLKEEVAALRVMSPLVKD
ncbi:cysteine desulfurase [Candidatus Woesearchaeota archaeon]|nr:cysteine desulfurase [Candidatus Woesearchaeota archaeon]